MKTYKEYIKEQELILESPNFSKESTGLPCNIYASDEVNNHNKPRLKFQNNYSDSITGISDYIPLSIPTSDSEEPEVLIDKKVNLKSKDFKYLKAWVKKYRKMLLKLWKKEIDARELRNFFAKERKKDIE